MRRDLVEYQLERYSEEPFGHDSPRHNGLVVGHVALHNSPNQNAGDTILPWAIRGAFDAVAGDFGWEFHHLWDRFSGRVVRGMNERLDGVVIGGGGFIIKDQWGSDIRRSGWSWNIGIEELRALEVPYCLFAVGYNRFRNSEEFDPHFTDHIRLTVEKAAFVGLRNSGSIRRVAAYLQDPEQIAKLTLQYCPTLSSRQLWPEFAEAADRFEADFATRDRPVLAFNFAGDRLEYRFPTGVESQMRACAEVARAAAADGWEVVLTAHKTIDRQLEPYLDAAGVEYVTHDLTGADTSEILAFYAGVDLAVGMRGHGQMIPLGLGRPILSIISHDKMGYLLEDIGHPEWGAEVDEEGWADALVEKIRRFGIDDRTTTLAHAAAAQAACWENTQTNVRTVVDAFHARAAGEVLR